MSTKRKYSLETKLEAIKLREEGYTVKEIQKLLNIKSESQIYTWWYWSQNGEHHRLSQPIGKQYSNGLGPEPLSSNDSLLNRNKILEYQIKILKKYEKMERKWYEKFS